MEIAGNINATTNATANTSNNCNSKLSSLASLTPEELVLLATTISIAITQCRTSCEIKTLINLTNLIQDNLVAILAQKNICKDAIEEIVI